MSMTPIKGYTEQPQAKLDAVNMNKEQEERLLRRVENLQQLGGVDGRWAAIAKTHFEEGFMALNRAIMQPQRVRLPEDGEGPELPG